MRQKLDCFQVGNGLLILLICLALGCSSGDGGRSTPTPEAQSNLPPDPGAAGLATLEGIDTNGNSVRDDVERYIALTYPSAADVNLRRTLTRYAQIVQVMLLQAGDARASVQHAADLDAVLGCLAADQTADLQTAYEGIQEQVLNTFDRIAAYLEADAHLGDATIPDQQQTRDNVAC